MKENSLNFVIKLNSCECFFNFSCRPIQYSIKCPTAHTHTRLHEIAINFFIPPPERYKTNTTAGFYVTVGAFRTQGVVTFGDFSALEYVSKENLQIHLKWHRYNLIKRTILVAMIHP